MHVCFVNLIIEYYSPISGGAISTCIMQQAKRLIARGHIVTVLTPVNGDETYSVGQVVPVTSRQRHELDLSRRIVSKFRNRINRWDFAYYEYYLKSVLIELHRIRPEAVICFNDLRLPSYVRAALPETRILARLSNEVATDQTNLKHNVAGIDRLLAVSGYIKDWVIRTYGVPTDKISVLANGSDLETFYPRADYLTPRHVMRVLFVGRTVYDKGPDLAVDAVYRLKTEGLPVTLTVVGARWFNNSSHDLQNDYVVNLRRQIERAGFEAMGHVDRHRIPRIMRDHDVVCIPSRWNDPMPQVAFEAMSSGCAVVASDRGGLPEACGGAAILFDPEDGEGFRAAIRRLVTNPLDLAKFKQQARARAQEMTWDRNVDMLERELMRQKLSVDSSSLVAIPNAIVESFSR